jgi:hypothetical protein
MADVQAKRDAKLAEKEEERKYVRCAARSAAALPRLEMSEPRDGAPQHCYAAGSLLCPCWRPDITTVRCACGVRRAKNEAIKKEKAAKSASRQTEKSAKEKAEESRLQQQADTAAKREAKIAEKEEERKRRAEDNAGKKKDAGQSKYSKKDVMELKVCAALRRQTELSCRAALH